MKARLMNAIVSAPNRFRRYVAGLGLAALAVTLLAVAFATGPAQAQDDPPVPTPTPTPTATPVVNTYPDPQPCGPGAGTASQPEPHEITTGHFALFDAYWRATARNQQGVADAGVLHTNLCPPKVVTTRENNFGTITETTTRSASNIDIGEAIFHVLDTHKVDVVATNAEATAGQLSLEEYPKLRKGLGLGEDDAVPAGTKVWWLRLDDPDTAADDTSNLRLGFSTALFDDEHWLTSAEGKPMRYKFEVQRYPADPADVPHFFAYEAPESSNAEATIVWNSFEADLDDDDMVLAPGEYRSLQWIFTHAGTYELSVHLQGFVRMTRLITDVDDPNYDINWRRISGNATETGEVKTYTIQVGSDLDENEPPVFGLNLSVPENSPAGVSVGDPIPVFEADAETLYYSLSGEGHEHFAVEPATGPHAVQIKVAAGASLDYETKPTYELTLSVSDRLDHESNEDTTIDDTLVVRIGLVDQAPGLVLQADREVLLVGEAVTLTARYEPTPEQRGQTFAYQWAYQTGTDDGVRWHVVTSAPNAATWSVPQTTAMSRTYRVAVALGEYLPPLFVESNEIEIRWGN